MNLKNCVTLALCLSVLIGPVSHAQTKGGQNMAPSNGAGYYPPGTKGNPGPVYGNGNGYNNGGYSGGFYPPGTKGNPAPVYGNNNGGYSGGYYPSQPYPYNPNYTPDQKGFYTNGWNSSWNQGYNAPKRDTYSFRNWVNDSYGRRAELYVGNRRIWQDRYENGFRVRSYHEYGTKGYFESRYRSFNFGPLSLYLYSPSHDSFFYSRFNHTFPYSCNNSWFSVNDPWYYRYQYYYPYRASYISPAQWALDQYMSTLLRQYQQDLQYSQELNGYQNWVIRNQMDLMLIRPQLENQVQQIIQSRQYPAQNPYAAQYQYPYQNQVPTFYDGSVGTTLLDPSHLYLVSDEIRVITPYGQNCTISRGDVIRVNRSSYYRGATVVQATVAASKDESCNVNSTFSISINDLQEFENDFELGIDVALETMNSDPTLRTYLY